MKRHQKAPTTKETLKDIQKKRISYGKDERLDFVEDVCRILGESRVGPYVRPRVRIAEQDAEAPPPTIAEIIDQLARSHVFHFVDGEYVRLSPGQAFELIMSNENATVGIIERTTAHDPKTPP